MQFAVGARDGHAYALKFFVIPDSFAAEQALYADSALGPFLPRLEAMTDNADGDLVDARGYALPPCIAMEKGESLDEWSRRAKPDLFMAVTVCPQPHSGAALTGSHRRPALQTTNHHAGYVGHCRTFGPTL